MTRSRLVVVAAAVVVAVVVGGFVAYDQVLRGDSAAALTLPTASTAPPASPAASAAASAAAASRCPSPRRPRPGWTARSRAPGPWPTDSVGRLPRPRAARQPLGRERRRRSDRRGDRLDHRRVQRVDDDPDRGVTDGRHDVHHLGRVRRDNRLRNEGLETDSFPTATFTLTLRSRYPRQRCPGPHRTDADRRPDAPRGDEAVQIPAQAQLVDGTIKVAGSIKFPLADYGIVAPNIGGFIVSIADDGTLEFLVNFSKS